MFESDADRLETIKSLGGQQVTIASGQKIWAIYDGAFVMVTDGMESSSPVLQCRTSDVIALDMGKEVQIDIPNQGSFYLHRHEPDSTGWSFLFLHRQ